MNVNLLDNKPAILNCLTKLRDKNSSCSSFYSEVNKISLLIIGEALKHAPVETIDIETPLESTRSLKIIEEKVIAVPILRAALGMVDSFLKLLPNATVFHVGLKRNEKTLEPIYYYDSLPENINKKVIYVLDPMLATGGSAAATIDLLQSKNPGKIVFCGIIGAPEGVKKLNERFPNVEIYLAALDSKLDENGYIRPGLGDAGDRIFGT